MKLDNNFGFEDGKVVVNILGREGVILGKVIFIEEKFQKWAIDKMPKFIDFN